jgi:acetyl esterase/lipase
MLPPMTSRFLLTLLMISSLSARAAQQTTLSIQDGQIIPLWRGPAPGALGDAGQRYSGDHPSLPRTMAANTPAVVICPGGAYASLASNHEGARWQAISCWATRNTRSACRHMPPHGASMRRESASWASAGGHLAMSASTLFDAGDPGAADPIDRAGSRPDFSVLGDPVITMSESWTHQGSKNNLLSTNADRELVRKLSGELAVTKQTPPAFLFHTTADTTVPVENSVYYYLAMRKAGIPAEMHIFENGPHGVGLANNDPALSEWSKLLANWLRGRGVVK